jgi:hypothetical protein
MFQNLSIKECHSCGYKFSNGRGLCADWFCSERCRDWYDNGMPAHGSTTGTGGYRVVAGPPGIEIGSVYCSEDRRKPNPNITLEQLLHCLEVSNTHLKKDYIEGKDGKVIVRQDGRNFWLDLTCSNRQLSSYKIKLRFMYNDDDKNKFFMYRLPTEKQAKAIRQALGLKKRPTFTPDIIARLKSNLPTPLETPRYWEKTALKQGVWH